MTKGSQALGSNPEKYQPGSTSLGRKQSSHAKRAGDENGS